MKMVNFINGYQSNNFKDSNYWNSNIPSRKVSSLNTKTEVYSRNNIK